MSVTLSDTLTITLILATVFWKSLGANRRGQGPGGSWRLPIRAGVFTM